MQAGNLYVTQAVVQVMSNHNHKDSMSMTEYKFEIGKCLY
ncbi:unnamed protein product [Brassica rapa subsp. trilocularis]